MKAYVKTSYLSSPDFKYSNLMSFIASWTFITKTARKDDIMIGINPELCIDIPESSVIFSNNLEGIINSINAKQGKYLNGDGVISYASLLNADAIHYNAMYNYNSDKKERIDKLINLVDSESLPELKTKLKSILSAVLEYETTADHSVGFLLRKIFDFYGFETILVNQRNNDTFGDHFPIIYTGTGVVENEATCSTPIITRNITTDRMIELLNRYDQLYLPSTLYPHCDWENYDRGIYASDIVRNLIESSMSARIKLNNEYIHTSFNKVRLSKTTRSSRIRAKITEGIKRHHRTVYGRAISASSYFEQGTIKIIDNYLKKITANTVMEKHSNLGISSYYINTVETLVSSSFISDYTKILNYIKKLQENVGSSNIRVTFTNRDQYEVAKLVGSMYNIIRNCAVAPETMRRKKDGIIQKSVDYVELIIKNLEFALAILAPKMMDGKELKFIRDDFKNMKTEFQNFKKTRLDVVPKLKNEKVDREKTAKKKGNRNS